MQSPLPVCALPSSSDAKLTAASAKSSTPLGDAAISWRCDGLTSGLSLNASVPVGATAELFLPTAFGGTVTEGGGGGGGIARPVFSDGKFVAGGVDGVVAGRSVVDAQAVVLELLSGSFQLHGGALARCRFRCAKFTSDKMVHLYGRSLRRGPASQPAIWPRAPLHGARPRCFLENLILSRYCIELYCTHSCLLGVAYDWSIST